MKWFIAFVKTVITSIVLIAGIALFNSFMAKQMVVWSNSNFMLGTLPRFAVEVHGQLTKNSFLVTLLIIIVSFAVYFTIALKKKK